MFYLSILRVYVLMKTSDNRAVNKKAPHYYDGFQNLPQCDLERKKEEIILVSLAQKIGWVDEIREFLQLWALFALLRSHTFCDFF